MSAAQTAAIIIAILLGLLSPFLLKYWPQLKDELEFAFVFVASLVAAAIITFATHQGAWSWANAGVVFTVLFTTQQSIYNLLKNRAALAAHYPRGWRAARRVMP